jgi:hypothetical protein
VRKGEKLNKQIEMGLRLYHSSGYTNKGIEGTDSVIGYSLFERLCPAFHTFRGASAVISFCLNSEPMLRVTELRFLKFGSYV